MSFPLVNLSQLETVTGWKRNFTSSTQGIEHLPLGSPKSGIFVEKHQSNGCIQEPKESPKVMLLGGPSLFDFYVFSSFFLTVGFSSSD